MRAVLWGTRNDGRAPGADRDVPGWNDGVCFATDRQVGR